ncbi:hypothetical protein HZF05_11640 [Sphingomonas sp. CGMCC 1.13654]|uniref:Uncharacterized protein n=1 Tax=Sphingomonas chungangi TaxID=2683589 RepID=A0A838L880_9SPHN|nr:hypothetical protein [Sphingomonas chungangi]MBA2934749.1 hypothetical protein [Sphingomonas chungangi]MVW58060.1 hypothetical protein [Sphingomonas chungangi]
MGGLAGWSAMKIAIACLAAAVVAGLSAAPVEAKSPIKHCYLAVDGKVRVNNPCQVFPLGGHSYTLNTWDGGKPKRSHFAQVDANSDGTGDATWNADPNDDHALDPLGTVRWVKGCWINRRAKICAR